MPIGRRDPAGPTVQKLVRGARLSEMESLELIAQAFAQKCDHAVRRNAGFALQMWTNVGKQDDDWRHDRDEEKTGQVGDYPSSHAAKRDGIERRKGARQTHPGHEIFSPAGIQVFWLAALSAGSICHEVVGKQER